MVKFDNVSKKFGSIFALEDVSFEIKKGEFVFVTGASGAGKTTILRLLLREFRPDSGRVFIENKDIATLRSGEVPFYRRKIGFVFQDFKLLPDRTVFENVALALEITGEAANAKSRIIEVLKEVDLSERANLFPRQLAGGEQQRTVIARALVGNPKIILADEPTGNLDPATGKQIISLLDRATQDGTTVIMATHNENLVNSLKRRVIKLAKGKVVSDKISGKYEE